MKFKVGEYWRTRDGRKARIICNDRKSEYGRTVTYLVSVPYCSDEIVSFVNEKGLGSTDQCTATDDDLIEPWTAPVEEVEVFEWMYQDANGDWRLRTIFSGDTTTPRDPNFRKTGRSWKVPK